MRLVAFDDAPLIEPPASGFRSGGIRFRDLLVGREGEPDNHGLQWVEVTGGYHAPRHRHNFEQVRIMLEGLFGFGPDQVQEAGSIGYFCEGTPYTQSGEGRSITLLLQVGGPSGEGFMSRRQLRDGVAALSRKGQFVDGVFTWHDEQGKKHNQDSYEAVWEHVHQRAITYPKPRYDAPLLMRPERFPWMPMRGVSRGWERSFGRFYARGLEVGQWRFEAGTSAELAPSDQVRLLFCTEGEGGFNGKRFERWTSVRIERGETPQLEVNAESGFHSFLLPQFD